MTRQHAPAVLTAAPKPAGRAAPKPAHACDCHAQGAPGFDFAQLTVSRPGDRDEVEADRIADAVLAGARTAPPTPCPACAARVHRMCATCTEEDEQERLQRTPDGPGPATMSVAGLGLRGGTPLPAGVRGDFEARFGHDFGRVRVHTDARAADAAHALSARAFTMGADVAFAPGEFQPATAAGRRLLAHELVHVIQQTGGAPRGGAHPAVSTSRVNRTHVQREGTEMPALGFGLDKHYPRCSDAQSRALQYEIEMARLNVAGAVAQLADELERIEAPQQGAGIITSVGGALDRYFKTRKPDLVKTILARLRRIGAILDRGPDNWTCLTQQQCAGFCSGSGTEAYACAGPASPVGVCDHYFTLTSSHVFRSMILVHEAAHQAGLGGDTYHFDKQFAGLGTFQAMVNADSFAYFVQETALGGLPPERADERMPKSWTPDIIGVTLNLRVPAPGGRASRSGYEDTHLSRGQSKVKNRLAGDIWFYTDVGEIPALARPMIFRAPRIKARITLHRRTAGGASKPEREVLFTQEASEGIYRGAGAPLGPDFTIDLAFDTADRGELLVEAWISDLETDIERKLTESFDVDP